MSQITRAQLDAKLGSILSTTRRITHQPLAAASIRNDVRQTRELLAVLDNAPAPAPVPFGHLYRISLGADHPSAKRPWNSGGAVFGYGPAPYEGHRGDIEYLNLYAK